MDSIFECGVCFKQYNHSEKKPLSLPCGHTFCLECLRQINKHSIIKCPFDKIAHHVSADNLPVNYAVLTALPITQMNSNTGQSGTPTAKDGGIQYCDIHKNKKVKFFCKSDQEMFCSKCVLKHTNAKHEVMPISFKSKLVLEESHLLHLFFEHEI
jgi:tripartite motif-containing protein 21